MPEFRQTNGDGLTCSPPIGTQFENPLVARQGFSPFSKTVEAATEHLIQLNRTVYLWLGLFNLFLGGLKLGDCLFHRHKGRYLNITMLCIGQRCLCQPETQIVFVGELLNGDFSLELGNERRQRFGVRGDFGVRLSK